MVMPLSGDAGAENGSVEAGQWWLEGREALADLQEEKGLLDGSEDMVLAWSSDEIFSVSFFHLKLDLRGQLD